MLRTESIQKIFRLNQFPLVKPGDDVAQLICDSVVANEVSIEQHDILVVAQKIISIAERRIRKLDEFVPTALAKAMAQKTNRDSRFVQAILDESLEIIRVSPHSRNRRGLIVTRTRLGVMTNAGIDKSNTGVPEPGSIVLLPINPDKSARNIASKMERTWNKKLGALIVDTAGDPDRNGAIGKAIGIANIPARIITEGFDLNGQKKTADINIADALAAFAVILMGEGDQATPVVIIRGIDFPLSPKARIKDILK